MEYLNVLIVDVFVFSITENKAQSLHSHSVEALLSDEPKASMRSTAMLENRLQFLHSLCHTHRNMKSTVPRINET